MRGFSDYRIVNAAFDAFGGTTQTGMTIDSATKKLGIRFYADRVTPIQGVDIFLHIIGSMTNVMLKASIQTDNAGLPSGTIVNGGAARTNAFAPPSSSAMTGLLLFTGGANTGLLSLNTPYWLVIEDGGGSASCSVGNTVGSRNFGVQNHGDQGRLYNGTDWTTVATVSSSACVVFQHTNGSYSGQASTAASTVSPRTVYGVNRTGVRQMFGVPVNVSGASFKIRRTGNLPSNLEVQLYFGPALKETVTLNVQAMQAGTGVTDQVLSVVFSQGYLLPAKTYVYVILHQAGNGGTASIYYTFWTSRPVSTYIDSLMGTSWRMVYGTNADPTQFTVSTDEMPYTAGVSLVDPGLDLVSDAIDSGVTYVS